MFFLFFLAAANNQLLAEQQLHYSVDGFLFEKAESLCCVFCLFFLALLEQKLLRNNVQLYFAVYKKKPQMGEKEGATDRGGGLLQNI